MYLLLMSSLAKNHIGFYIGLSVVTFTIGLDVGTIIKNQIAKRHNTIESIAVHIEKPIIEIVYI